MEYLALDLSALPMRAMRLSCAKDNVTISDVAQGPQRREDEAAWLKRWHKEQPRFLKNPPLLAIWEDLEMTLKIHAPTQAEEPVKTEKALPAEREKKEQANPIGTFKCPLSAAKTETGRTPLEMEVGVPLLKINELLHGLRTTGYNCQKISVLALVLWQAFAATYPEYSEQTVAIAWGTHDKLSLSVVDHGQLSFYRALKQQLANPSPYALFIKECLEQFSFSFPYAAIDLILLGGMLPEPERLKDWSEELLRYPCSSIAPLHSKHISCFKKGRGLFNDAMLAPYWPCLGLGYGHMHPWP